MRNVTATVKSRLTPLWLPKPVGPKACRLEKGRSAEMLAATGDREIDLRRLYWVGPTTVAAAVLVVRLLQIVAVAILRPPGRSLLRSERGTVCLHSSTGRNCGSGVRGCGQGGVPAAPYLQPNCVSCVGPLVFARCGARIWVDPW